LDVLSARHVALAWETGSLATLSTGCQIRAGVHLWAGQFAEAEAMVAEADSVSAAIGSSGTPLRRAGRAYRGRDAKRLVRIRGRRLRTACDDPPAGPARGAYRRGSRPARGRDQRAATIGSTVAGHQDGHGRIDQPLAYRSEVIPGVNLAPVAEASAERAACTATAIRWARIYFPQVSPRTLPGIVIDNNDFAAAAPLGARDRSYRADSAHRASTWAAGPAPRPAIQVPGKVGVWLMVLRTVP
jgi:hypothetical protein